MQVDLVQEHDLRAKFAGLKVVMAERNLKQATLIPSARVLPNPLGSAPGWFVEKDGHIIVAMPGVPREMYRMWEQEAVPRLALHTGGTIFTRLLRIAGLGESSVEEVLDPLIHTTNPTVATYAKQDAVDVRISAKAESMAEAERLVAATEVEARALLGEHVFGTDKDTLASVVGKLLQERHLSLGVMESMTGGLLASTITDVAGSSGYFIGGLVSYSTHLKAQLGVPSEILEQHGAVSEETARAMAHVVRERLGTDIGISITGVAGPDEQEGKSVGTVYMAIEGPFGARVIGGPRWRASRADNKRLAVLGALNLLRGYLLKHA
jgi:nicotinamide-nucleotide amidase